MKEIIYSIVCAFIINVVLALIFPTWFLKGDAGWTYLSDTARVDVALIGNVKNSRVTAEGADTRTSQPAWFSDKTYQGTVVEVSVSYRSKSYKIRIVPHAAECGKNASLVLTFRGADIRENGRRRPAWVTFRNIALNGQITAQRQKVWHDKPFILKYPPHTSEIALSFDVQKPLSSKDISFTRIIPTFIALLLLSLFFSPLKRAAAHALILTNRKDIAKVIFDGYRNIDPVYRRSFWIIFGVLCFAFGFHTICFMWGNHDWSLLDSTHQWREHAYEGRYMLFCVKTLLSKGLYLPLLHDMITFAVLALNAVLLCKYWHLERRITYYVLCGLVLVIQPFTLSMVYFVNMTPEVFIGVTFTLVALILSEKVSLGVGSITMKIVYSLIAIVLINFALAMYAVLLNTIAVACVGRLLIRSLDWDGSRRQLISCMKSFVISATHIILGIALYKLIITFAFSVRSAYNTDTLPLAQVPERLLFLLKQSFHQLYMYDMPFLPQWILWIFLGFTVVLVLYICCTGNLKQKLLRLLLLLGALFATQTVMIIAKTYMHSGRIELFGLVFFEVLVMMLIPTHIRQLHNLWVITGACIVFTFIISDLDCLRVWKLGFDAEKMLWNRVLSRMEAQKDFSPARKYDVLLVGAEISMRPRYYAEPCSYDRGHANILFEAYDFSHDPFSALQFYYPTRFRGRPFSGVMASPGARAAFESRLKRLYEAGVLQKAEVWPRPNGLIVWKDIILFVTDAKELNNYKKKFERELGMK